MYQLPIKDNDRDFLNKNDHEVKMKTFGLPYVFWFYALAFTIFLALLSAHTYPLVLKLIDAHHLIDKTLGFGLISLILILFFAQFAFLFFGKKIRATKEEITVSYYIGPLTFYWKTIQLSQDKTPYEVCHHLDSPNMARIQNKPNTQGFQNRGYYVLFARNEEDKLIEVDRHSLRKDLEKIKDFLIF